MLASVNRRSRGGEAAAEEEEEEERSSATHDRSVRSMVSDDAPLRQAEGAESWPSTEAGSAVDQVRKNPYHTTTAVFHHYY